MKDIGMVLGIVAALCACGAGDDAADGAAGSFGGVPEAERLRDLDEAQFAAVCMAGQQRAVEAAGDDFVRGGCLLRASLSVAMADALGVEVNTDRICGEEFAACLSEPAELGACDYERPGPMCEATVGDYGACLGTLGDRLTELAASSCEQVISGAMLASADGESGLAAEVSRCDELLAPCLMERGDAPGPSDPGGAGSGALDGGGGAAGAVETPDAGDAGGGVAIDAGGGAGTDGGGVVGDSSDTCCVDGDPCFFADDQFCDCPGQSWDASDCG